MKKKLYVLSKLREAITQPHGTTTQIIWFLNKKIGLQVLKAFNAAFSGGRAATVQQYLAV